jgi:tRNA U34 5-methylaminomethyl-2-thiouridine-forming methyltransferase MnmC
MAQLSRIDTQDGSHSLYSETFGESYHSRYGAIRESRHVFIEAGLFPLLLSRKAVSILELGFGTGLNALLTLSECQVRDVKVYYEAVEAFPVAEAAAAGLNYPLFVDDNRWQAAFREMHRAPWNESVDLAPGFTLRKTLARFESVSYPPTFHLAYFDAFAPGAQPELWEPAVLGKVYEALLPGGALVTYCAKGAVKRTLRGLGFEVSALPGPPGKREMTRAVKPG